MTNEWCFDRLANQVVSQLDVGSRVRSIKEVEVVFTVGCCDGALVTHVGETSVKNVLTRPFADNSLQEKSVLDRPAT